MNPAPSYEVWKIAITSKFEAFMQGFKDKEVAEWYVNHLKTLYNDLSHFEVRKVV